MPFFLSHELHFCGRLTAPHRRLEHVLQHSDWICVDAHVSGGRRLFQTRSSAPHEQEENIQVISNGPALTFGLKR